MVSVNEAKLAVMVRNLFNAAGVVKDLVSDEIILKCHHYPEVSMEIPVPETKDIVKITVYPKEGADVKYFDMSDPTGETKFLHGYQLVTRDMDYSKVSEVTQVVQEFLNQNFTHECQSSKDSKLMIRSVGGRFQTTMNHKEDK